MEKTLTNREHLQVVDAADELWSTQKGLYLLQEHIFGYMKNDDLGCALAPLISQMGRALNQIDEVVRAEDEAKTPATGE